MIKLTTTKGRFAGTAAQCGRWLEEMQPSMIQAEHGEISTLIEVPGTPGARVYERALEIALVSDEEIAALRTEAINHNDRAQVDLCDRAWDGDETARNECAQVIVENRNKS